MPRSAGGMVGAQAWTNALLYTEGSSDLPMHSSSQLGQGHQGPPLCLLLFQGTTPAVDKLEPLKPSKPFGPAPALHLNYTSGHGPNTRLYFDMQ